MNAINNEGKHTDMNDRERSANHARLALQKAEAEAALHDINCDYYRAVILAPDISQEEHEEALAYRKTALETTKFHEKHVKFARSIYKLAVENTRTSVLPIINEEPHPSWMKNTTQDISVQNSLKSA